MKKESPQIKKVQIIYNKKKFTIEYFRRKGFKETILFLHGLGGAKENFWDACKINDLSDYNLICFDNPGTGNSSYYKNYPLNVDDLTEITALFIEKLNIDNFFVVGTSMGGLTGLLYLRKSNKKNVKAFINIEGNLMLEDCMFSGKVITYNYDDFAKNIFLQSATEMKKKGNAGYHIISNNLLLNTNVESYYQYSFQTVEYSLTGNLLHQYKSLGIPRLFIYGDENSNLSYLPELIKEGLNVKPVSNSNHFVFYDNPMEMYEIIAGFINNLC